MSPTEDNLPSEDESRITMTAPKVQRKEQGPACSNFQETSSRPLCDRKSPCQPCVEQGTEDSCTYSVTLSRVIGNKCLDVFEQPTKSFKPHPSKVEASTIAFNDSVAKAATAFKSVQEAAAALPKSLRPEMTSLFAERKAIEAIRKNAETKLKAFEAKRKAVEAEHKAFEAERKDFQDEQKAVEAERNAFEDERKVFEAERKTLESEKRKQGEQAAALQSGLQGDAGARRDMHPHESSPHQFESTLLPGRPPQPGFDPPRTPTRTGNFENYRSRSRSKDDLMPTNTKNSDDQHESSVRREDGRKTRPWSGAPVAGHESLTGKGERAKSTRLTIDIMNQFGDIHLDETKPRTPAQIEGKPKKMRAM